MSMWLRTRGEEKFCKGRGDERISVTMWARQEVICFSFFLHLGVGEGHEVGRRYEEWLFSVTSQEKSFQTSYPIHAPA